MATETEFWGRPMAEADTANRARIVREALRHLAVDPLCCKILPHADREAAWMLATAGSDETMTKLGRLLK